MSTKYRVVQKQTDLKMAIYDNCGWWISYNGLRWRITYDYVYWRGNTGGLDRKRYYLPRDEGAKLCKAVCRLRYRDNYCGVSPYDLISSY